MKRRVIFSSQWARVKAVFGGKEKAKVRIKDRPKEPPTTPPPAVEDASSETSTCYKWLPAALGRRSKSKATPTDSDAVDTSSETLTCNKLIQKLSPKLLRKKKETGKDIAS